MENISKLWSKIPLVGKKEEIASSRIETKVPDTLFTLSRFGLLSFNCAVLGKCVSVSYSVISFLCQNRNSPY
jgi:hypothetical protein